MKKLTTMAMLAAACWAASAALVGIELKAGATAPMEAGRVVAAQAVSTNATGTVTVVRGGRRDELHV